MMHRCTFIAMLAVTLLVTSAAWSQRIQAENNFTVVVDAQSDNDVVASDFQQDDGYHVCIHDPGDAFGISFNITKPTWYRINVRNRSGSGTDPSSKTYFWSQNAYQYLLDGGELAFSGDTSTLTGTPDAGDGHTIWGVANSGYVFLTYGSHRLVIKAKEWWQKVDYIEIVEKRWQSESNYYEITDAGGNNIGVGTGFTQDDGNHVSFPDVNDTVGLRFWVPLDGHYRVRVRVRSGYSGNKKAYWDNGNYVFQLNGVNRSFTGVETSITATTDADGSTYWGTMVSNDTIYLTASTAGHVLSVRATGTYQKVDFVEADDVTLEVPSTGGMIINPGVRGQNLPTFYNVEPSPSTYDKVKAISDSTSIRSLPFGGLDADRYDWRHLFPAKFTRMQDAHAFEMLAVLKTLRDTYSLGVFTASMWGGNDIIQAEDTGRTRYIESSYPTNYLVASSAYGDQVYDDERYVKLFDPGDAIEFSFTPPISGDTSIWVRVRSGDASGNTSYWNNNAYTCTLNGSPITVVGDPYNSLSTEIDSNSVYWGTMKSTSFYASSSQSYTFRVTANTYWCMVDYLEVRSGDGSFIMHLPPNGVTGTAQLAADWVRYCNIIVQNYRHDPNNGNRICDLSGNPVSLSGDNLRVYESIRWGRDANGNIDNAKRLLPLGAAPVPKAIYWEIGNEPELPGVATDLTNHYLSPAEYSSRYHTIRNAMRAVDPDVKTGPCLMEPHKTPTSPYLAQLRNDGRTLDFVAYHPYYWNLRNAWGNVTNMSNALRDLKATMDVDWEFARRYSPTLFATEYSASKHGDEDKDFHRSMGDAMGQLESVFTFAQEELQGAHYWITPTWSSNLMQVFDKLQSEMPAGTNRLLKSYYDGYYTRVYATRNDDNIIRLWCLNFADEVTKSLVLKLTGLDASSEFNVTTSVFKAAGDTSLMTVDGIEWRDTTTVEKSGEQLLQYPVTLEDATITLIKIAPK